MDFVWVKAVDGTRIPISAHLVGDGAMITVDGDGGCRLNSADAYLVSVVNRRRQKTSREKVEDGAQTVKDGVKDAAADKVKDVVKEELIPAVLKAMGLKRAATYMYRGAKLVATWPAQLVLGMFTDATEIGDETWRSYRQPLANGDSALIRWFGSPD